MPADELVVHVPGDVGQVALALLGQELREEVDLEQEVAELVEKLLGRVRDRRVRDLVGLLDGVRDDRPRGLLAVPRTVAAKALGQGLQALELVAEPRPTAQPLEVVVPAVAVAAAGGLNPTW